MDRFILYHKENLGCREATNTAFKLPEGQQELNQWLHQHDHEGIIINYQDLQSIGMTNRLAFPTLIAICSIALGKTALSRTSLEKSASAVP